MDNLIPIPVTMVAAIANTSYLDVLRIAETVQEGNPDEPVFITHLGDPKGAVDCPTASAIIMTAAMQMMADAEPVDDDTHAEECEA